MILSEPFATVARRAGAVVLADLSQLGVPYTMHGFGVRKSYIQANRDVVVRFMKAYLEGIYVFKTNKDVALNVLKKIHAARRSVPGANVLRRDVPETDP